MRPAIQRTGLSVRTRFLAVSAVLVLLGGASIMAAPASGASGNTLYVGSTTAGTNAATDCTSNANTDCTLDDAVGVYDAATYGVVATIDFIAPSGTYGTDGADLANGTTGGTLNITGHGASSTMITGAGANEVFAVEAGNVVSMTGLTVEDGTTTTVGGGIANSGTLTLTNVVVKDSDSTKGGGGIANVGSLVATDVTVTGNNAGLGGGIASLQGTLTLNDSQVTGNFGAIAGGGIVSGTMATGPSGTLILNDSRVTKNTSTGGGGGILNHAGTTTITNSEVNDNTSKEGGGIASGSGNGGVTILGAILNVNDSQVDGNTAFGGNGTPTGAGIANGGTATLIGSQVDDNSAPGGLGGGILNHGIFTLTSSKVDDNTAAKNTMTTPGQGAGIDNVHSPSVPKSGVFTAVASQVDNNQAAGEGGGIDNLAGATFNASALTISGNTSGTVGGGIANNGGTAKLSNATIFGDSATKGGGLSEHGGTALLTNDTLSGNSATAGGAVYNLGGGVTLAGSLLAANTPGANCAGTKTPPVTDGQYNVADDSSCGFGPKSISNSKTIGTLTLAANGSTGPQTAAITTSSSAFGAVPKSACTLTTDERGFPRPGTGFSNCDAGAFELQGALGYNLAGSDGGVFAFPPGRSPGFEGSLPTSMVTVSDIVGIAGTSDGGGYWLVGSNGGVFSFGDAAFHGSSGQINPSVAAGGSNSFSANDIVGIAGTGDGGGYLLVGSNGGVYALGDATYAGSLPGIPVNVSNVIGMVVTP